MKKTLVAALVFVCSLCSGQSLFFRNLKHSVWIGEDTALYTKKDIGLHKLTVPENELCNNTFLWTFGDSLVISSHSNFTSTTVATYAYEADSKQCKLHIHTGRDILIYSAGITSAGSFVLLIRKNKKV